MQTSRAYAVALSLLLFGCGDDADPAGDSGAVDESGDTTTMADDGSTGAGDTGSPACPEDDFVVVGPFVGPGWDPQDGLIGDPADTYMAHATVIQLKPDPDAVQEFQQLVGDITAQLDQSDGLIGYQLGQSTNCGTARTIGLWRDQDAMTNFVFSGAHMIAIAQFPFVADGGTTTSWQTTPDTFPLTFETARPKLEMEN